MRAIQIYRNNTLAGILTEENRQHFVFKYDDNYFADTSKSGISLTLPKTQKKYSCEYLFPFFSNMIAEGENKKIQCQHLKIDEIDQFGLLMSTAGADTIGNITVRKISKN